MAVKVLSLGSLSFSSILALVCYICAESGVSISISIITVYQCHCLNHDYYPHYHWHKISF